jgi:glyoxylate/succinic semialdehyde reductase
MMTTLGFLGLGIMGKAMALNLIKAGFDLVVWNRDSDKCLPLAEAGARVAVSPAAVTTAADVTFAMLSDAAAAESVCFGPQGVLEGMTAGKGYVDFSTIDAATSRNIAVEIAEAGGRFLEAPVSGSKQPAENGQLVILAAGDPDLYEELESVFAALSKKSIFLGEVGQGAHMKIVVNMVMGGMMAAFGEGLAVGAKCGLNCEKVLEVLGASAIVNPMFTGKGPQVLDDNYSPAFPLKHMHKDLRMAIDLGDENCQRLSVAMSALEVFDEAMDAGMGHDDFSAVCKSVRQ